MADFIFERYDKRFSKIVIPEIVFRDGKLAHIALRPIQTEVDVEYQPKLLHGDEAYSALKIYQSLCAELGTNVKIKDEKGLIELGK